MPSTPTILVRLGERDQVSGIRISIWSADGGGSRSLLTSLFPLSPRRDHAAHRVESQQGCSSAPDRSYKGGNKTSIGSLRTSIDKSISSEWLICPGFPLHYTVGCYSKQQQGRDGYNDCRLALLGNSWSVPVIVCLLNQLLSRLGLMSSWTPQDILDELRPGNAVSAQGRLFRLPLNPMPNQAVDESKALASTLGNLISVNGEDSLLTTPATQLVKYPRLRATVPARCCGVGRWLLVGNGPSQGITSTASNCGQY